MELTTTPLDAHLVKVTLAGRMDTYGVDRIETKFVSAIVPGGNNAVVDLSGVDFITSMGIRMLVSTARSLKHRNLKLALYGANSHVSEIFEAVSLQKIIPICATEADALEAVAATH